MSDSPLISVRGEAVLEVEPEIARVIVYVQSRDTDRRKALDHLTDRNQQVLQLIRSYGEAVEKLETSGLTVMPVMRDERKDKKAYRYQATVRINLTIADFAVLGELVTRLGDQELTTVSGPWWSLRPGSEVYRRARHQAAREAVTRAREYAAALDCALTGLVELADEGLTTNSVSRPAARHAMALSVGTADSGPSPIEIEPEAQTVRAAVEARFTATAPKEL